MPPKLTWPKGANLARAVGAVTGSGWIVGAFIGWRADSTGNELSSGRINLAIDGGVARNVLTIYGISDAFIYDCWGQGGGGIALLLRYSDGFVPSRVAVRRSDDEWGVLYVPD